MYPEASSRLDVPTRPDVPTRLFATVKPPRKFAGMPKGDQKPKFLKQPGFEHLPQEAQPRLVCVLASLERNKNTQAKICPKIKNNLRTITRLKF